MSQTLKNEITMRSTNTFGIQFIIRKNKLKNGLVPIYARITVDAKRVEVSMKRKIDPQQWNHKQGMAKGSREEIRSLNHYLQEVRSRIVECYQEMQIQKCLITAEAIKNMLLGTDLKKHTLTKLVNFHNTKFKETLAQGTLKNYYTTQRYIQRFLKDNYGTTDMFLSELSYKFITNFIHFC